MYEVASCDVFLCLKLFVPILDTLELLTISIVPCSALFESVIKGGLNNEDVSKDENGNKLRLIFVFLNITE